MNAQEIASQLKDQDLNLTVDMDSYVEPDEVGYFGSDYSDVEILSHIKDRYYVASYKGRMVIVSTVTIPDNNDAEILAMWELPELQAEEEIYEALVIRENGIGEYISNEKQWQQFIGQETYRPEDSKYGNTAAEIITALESLREKGNAYFAQGWRLHETDRSVYSVSTPTDAMWGESISAGYIAGTPAHRIRYITRINA